jgi:MFS family permease
MQFLAQIDWSTPSWDLFIILFFLLASIVYGFSLGRDRIIIILVTVYMALAVVNYAPFLGTLSADIGVAGLFAFRVSAFVVSFMALFFMMSRSALAGTLGRRTSDGSWWQTFVFSFLQTGLLIAAVFSFLPASITDNLAPLTKQLFVNKMAMFVWIILPIIFMMMIRGHVRAEDKDDR